MPDDEGGTAIRNFTYTAIPMHAANGRVDGVALYGNDLTLRIADVFPDDLSDDEAGDASD
ncbi:MAG: hypothetical protein M3437_03010 [Chloroflexota bacterium]|nr:hypothetical protein [Chloroflexota bacterium]MDQ5867562.1 hypothetical protein [Chloroflexota bacterium]